MPKLNAVLMVLLSAGVIGGMGWWVLGRGDDGAVERTRTAKLLRKLADADPDLRREAETAIQTMGARGKDLLRETSKGADPRLAARAAALLKAMEPAPASTDVASLEPLLWCSDRLAVEFRNSGGAPLLIALEKKGEEHRFGWFEVEDGNGAVTAVQAESYAPPVVEGPAHLVAIPPGARQVLYQGWESVGAILRTRPGPCKVRFVYDASEGSPYREVVKVSALGVPLKPARFSSPPAESE